MQIRMLVVDDDMVACVRYKNYFETHGYDVSIAHDGNHMWQQIQQQNFAIILLDVGLPGKDGLELARELRAYDEHLGIIIVSARDDDVDKIVGLESGANDYVTKPFNSRELLSRVKIVIRDTHNKKPSHLNNQINFGSWSLDCIRRILVNQDGIKADLSQGEMNILIYLAQRPGIAVSREILMHQVSSNPENSSDRTVDVLISRLRRKLELEEQNGDLITTVRGEGYALMGVLTTP